MHPDNYDPSNPAYDYAASWPVAKVTAAPLWWDDRSDNLRALHALFLMVSQSESNLTNPHPHPYSSSW